jgi:DNA primase
MRLPDSFLEQVSRATDIVAVIGAHVALKPSGQSYKGLCPFHDERTPSFSVHPIRRRFYCFGCSAGGTVFQFLMKQEGLTFIEAVKKLALAANIPFPDLDEQNSQQTDAPLYRALQFAADLYHTTLLSDPGAQAARDYLLRRGLSPDDWVTFTIGYAPDISEFLQRALPPSLTLSHLTAAGLVTMQERRPRDVFHARIIFPIRDPKGQICGLAGRIGPWNQQDSARWKYVNTAETPIFQKSSLLYLYDRAVAMRGREKTLLLVEGYLDAIALHKAGWTNSAAIMGTTLSRAHIDLISKAGWRPMLCLDADEPGTKAVWKNLPLLLDTGLKPAVCTLPVPGDPDEFLHTHGPQAFHAAVAQARPLFDWACDQIALARRQGRADDYRTLLSQMQTAIDHLSDPLHREGLREMLAQRFAPALAQERTAASANPVLPVPPLERRLVHALTLRWLTPAQLARLCPEWCSVPAVARLAQIYKAQSPHEFPLVLEGPDASTLHPLIRSVQREPDPPPPSTDAVERLLDELERAWYRRQFHTAIKQDPLHPSATTLQLLTRIHPSPPRPPL